MALEIGFGVRVLLPVVVGASPIAHDLDAAGEAAWSSIRGLLLVMLTVWLGAGTIFNYAAVMFSGPGYLEKEICPLRTSPAQTLQVSTEIRVLTRTD